MENKNNARISKNQTKLANKLFSKFVQVREGPQDVDDAVPL